VERTIARLRGGGGPLAGEMRDIELKETVVSGSGEAAGEITGQILVSNDRYRFVIVNLGSDDGIEVGSQGTIESDGAPAGMAAVKKLYSKMCLADVIQTAPGQRVTKRSVVKFSRPSRRGGA